MRPELLVVEGFTAFRQRTEVDFRGADLFALWGPTGAGKSSLIDAMVFALYGSVPRYANKNLVAPVISQQELEARVWLRFSVGGSSYVAARVVRADGKGGASTREARLERLPAAAGTTDSGTAAGGTAEGEAGELLAGDAEGVTAAVEALLGLSYEHFTTCVVLPQGDFARFLHNTPKDRQALLIRLLDLGIYARMASLAGERSKVARVRRELHVERLAELSDRTPARRAELQTRTDALAGLMVALDSANPTTDQLVRAHEQATAEAAAAAAWAERLARVEVPEAVSGLADLLEAADAGVIAAQADLAAAEKAVAEAEAAVMEHPPSAELEVLLGRHVRRDELKTAGAALASALEQARAAAAAARTAEAGARAAEVAAEVALDAAQAQLARCDEQLAARPAAAELEALLERHDELERLTDRLARGRAVLEGDRGALDAAERQAEQALHEVMLAEQRVDAARASDLAADLASGLRAGDPCPVCGHEVGHLPARHDGELRAARAGLAAASERSAAVADGVAELGRRLAGAEQLYLDLGQRSGELRAFLATRGTRAEVLDALADTRALMVARREAADVLEEARRRWRSARDVEGVEQAARRAGELLARAEQEQHDLDAALDRATAELADRPDRAATEQRLLLVRCAEDARRAAGETQADARRRLVDARDRREAAARRAEELWDRYDETRDTFAALDPPRPTARTRSPGAAAEVVGAWTDLAAWARGASAHQRIREGEAASSATRAAAELRGLIDDFRGRAEALGVTVGARAVRDAVVDAASRAEADLARIEEDLVRAEALAARVTEATEQEQVSGELARHLQSNRFQKWLLDEAMARLVIGATGVLHQLSNGAYSLAHDRRTGNFSVIDHRNADGTRSVRTLSGGETFLASLALALALADQVAQLAQGGVGPTSAAPRRAPVGSRGVGSGGVGSGSDTMAPGRSTRLESIFLDEGFGTLDPEALDTVASAIEELASMGRMVGVVSHVRDLAERLPVRFEVARGPNGATVTRSGDG